MSLGNTLPQSCKWFLKIIRPQKCHCAGPASSASPTCPAAPHGTASGINRLRALGPGGGEGWQAEPLGPDTPKSLLRDKEKVSTGPRHPQIPPERQGESFNLLNSQTPNKEQLSSPPGGSQAHPQQKPALLPSAIAHCPEMASPGWCQSQTVVDLWVSSGSKQEKEYIKAVYCHPAYLTYMQSTS